MKIIQLIPRMESGGAEQHVFDLCKYAVRARHEVFLVSQGGAMIGKLDNVQFCKMPTHSKNVFVMIANIFRLVKIIRTKKIDILHAHSRSPAWSAFFACKFTSCKFITTYHGAYKQNNFLKKFYNSIMIKSDLTLANSKWTKQFVLNEYNVKAKFASIGIDCEKFSPTKISLARKNALLKKWGVQQNNFLVLHLARLSKIKGQKIVIEAAKKIVANNNAVYFVLAGSSHKKNNYESELRALIKKYKLEKNVKLVGQCQDAPAALAICNIALCVSTQEETLGLATLEAMAMKKDVIATNIGASRELISATRGWKIVPNNARKLAKAIEAIIALSPQKKAKIRQNARQFVLANFEKNNACKKIINIYKQILKIKD